MKQKNIVKKGLQTIAVWHDDTTLTSPEYFQITEFPTRLTAGKNLIKLRINNRNFVPDTPIDCEIIDYNGDLIYNEFIDYIDDDKSRVISIYIYDDTPVGDCLVVLTGTSKHAPAEWQNQRNIRWHRPVTVNSNIANSSEIIYTTAPTLTVNEYISTQLNRQYQIAQYPTYSSGSVKYYSYNNHPVIELIGGVFNDNMVNGTLTVTNPINPTPNTQLTNIIPAFTSTIKKILSPTTAVLDQEYTYNITSSLSTHTYRTFQASAYSIQYEESPNYTVTENSHSFALVELTGLEPQTGDVSRLKIFTNNTGTIGTWELVNDIELIKTDIFVTHTSSLYPNQPVGSFVSQSIIDTYWEGHSYIGKTETTPPVLLRNTASIANGLQIQNSIDISPKNAVTVVQIKPEHAGVFFTDTSYKIVLDAIGGCVSSSTATVSLYMSGSSFDFDSTNNLNQSLPVKLGKYIGQLDITTNTKRFDDVEFEFTADYNGTGCLLLVVESGNWQVSDIRTTTNNDTGYTPNYARIHTLIPTTHKSDNQLTFKVEYYNVNGERSKQESYLYNKPWEGGNRYIDGDFSMLTGSLYVADSLNSGIAISGYTNTGYVRSLGYDGFTAGYPGFLIWSGSALSGSAGTKGGVPYSGVGLELYANTASYFRYSTTDSEIDVRTNKFYFGNSSTFISGSNGNLEISSSNFIIKANGDVSASNIDISGVSSANVILNKSVTITTTNSSSYLQVIPAVNPGLFFGYTPAYYKLYLNGQLGGEIIQKAIIGCSFPLYIETSEAPPYTSISYSLAIADIIFPTSSNGTATCIIEVSSSGVYFRDDVAGTGFTAPIWEAPDFFGEFF